MNSKILYFIGGLVVGSAASFFITKHFCDLEKEKEIDDIKKTYSDRPLLKVVKKEIDDMGFKFHATELSPKEAIKLNNKLKSDILENREIIQKQNYNLFSKPPHARDIHNGIDENEDLEVEFVENYPKEGAAEAPYIITPNQFVNEEPYFDKITLEYYDDGILANAISEEIIEDIGGAIGLDSLTKFGEYEDDAVYVRNEKRSTDYEVIRQYRPFVVLDEDN